MCKKLNKKGYTIIEVVLVITIILVVGAIIMFKQTSQSNSTKDVEHMQNSVTVKNYLAISKSTLRSSGNAIQIAQYTINTMSTENDFVNAVNPYSTSSKGIDTVVQTTDTAPASVTHAIEVYSVKPSKATLDAIPLGTLVIFNGELYFGTAKPKVVVAPPAGGPTTVIDRTAPNIISTVIYGLVQYNSQSKLVRGSDGTLYAVYYDGLSYNEIYCKKSIDHGLTWTDMGFPQFGTYNEQEPSIAIDASNNLYVVWTGTSPSTPSYAHIAFSKYNGATWSTPINIENVSATLAQITPSIAVDSLNNLHVVWMGSYASQGQQIKYSKSTNGGTTWSAWINVALSATKQQEQPSIAIDSKNNVHLMWDEWSGTIAEKVMYSKYNGTSWSLPVDIQPSTTLKQECPCITVDESDNLHVVWEGFDATNQYCLQIKYSKFNGTSWSTWVNIASTDGYQQKRPTIAIDYLNNIHVVWEGTSTADTVNLNIYYSKFDGSIWSTAAKITSGAKDNSDANMCRNYKYFTEPLIIWRDWSQVVRFKGKWLEP